MARQHRLTVTLPEDNKAAQKYLKVMPRVFDGAFFVRRNISNEVATTRIGLPAQLNKTTITPQDSQSNNIR